MFRPLILCLPLLLGGCPGAGLAGLATGILVPPLLDAGQSSVASGKALVIERNERRSSVRHARYRAENKVCQTIADEYAKADNFAKKLALAEMEADCETLHYPGLFEGDIFTGLREGDERPRIEMDTRRLSERAAELDQDKRPADD